MDFTREPVIETVITARDGHRIVVRSSKNSGQEEFFVEALEVVCFHNTCFYRCLERPKAFIVPASDYEVLEVRESRISLKTPSFEGIVKSGNVHRLESSLPKSTPQVKQNEKEQAEVKRDSLSLSRDSFEKKEFHKLQNNEHDGKKEPSSINKIQPLNSYTNTQVIQPIQQVSSVEKSDDVSIEGSDSARSLPIDRRKDKKKNLRRKKSGIARADIDRDETASEEKGAHTTDEQSEDEELSPLPHDNERSQRIEKIKNIAEEKGPIAPIPSILPPPTTLIRDELARMRNNELYKGAFYAREEERSNLIQAEEERKTQEEDSAIVTPVSLQEEVKPSEEKNLLLSSSLRFEDEDEDSTKSYMYTARPVMRKKRENSESSDSEAVPPPLL